MTFFAPQPPHADDVERSAGEGRRSTVHAVGAVGLLVLPAMLVFASLLTAFQKWAVQDETARAAIDQKAFPLMIAAGVIMAVSAIAVLALRTSIRGRFPGGNVWAVLAVLAIPVSLTLAGVGFANL